MLVGRDIEKMDIAACRRAAIESISENFVDGVVSAVFWYALLGIPGLLLFKVASTMDSMVGYKTPPYFYFGWCGARLDDLMNYIPARLTWLLLGFFAIPKGWRVGIAATCHSSGPKSRMERSDDGRSPGKETDWPDLEEWPARHRMFGSAIPRIRRPEPTKTFPNR